MYAKPFPHHSLVHSGLKTTLVKSLSHKHKGIQQSEQIWVQHFQTSQMYLLGLTCAQANIYFEMKKKKKTVHVLSNGHVGLTAAGGGVHFI